MLHRVSFSAAVGVVALLGVSIGLCQTAPRALPPAATPVVKPSTLEDLTDKLPPPPLPQGLPDPIIPLFQPPPSAKPMGIYIPPAPFAPPAISPAPAEKMIVKVYSVPDLVADLQPQSSMPSMLGGMPELAAAVQQMQVYAQTIQAAQATAPGAPEVPDEVTRKLERLKKALRVAAPKKSWTEEGGDGEIEVFSEGLCLIVRHNAATQEAIGDLLTQLRATRDIQIELTMEVLSFDGVKDEVAAEAMKMLNRGLSAEELAQFRQAGGKTAMTSVVRIANGRTSSAGVLPGLPIQLTAVTPADKSSVDFRMHLTLVGDDAEDMLPMSQAMSPVRSVAVGKSLAFIIDPAGSTIMLVTPTIIDRSVATAK